MGARRWRWQACVDARDEDRLMELRVAVAKSSHVDRAKHLKQIDDVYADSRIRWKSELETQGKPKTVLGAYSMHAYMHT